MFFKQEPMAPRDPNRNYLRAHSKTGGFSRPQSAREPPKENKNPVSPKFASKDDIDFIKLNSQFAKQVSMKRAPSVEMLKHVQEKLNHDLEKYRKSVKGKIPH